MARFVLRQRHEPVRRAPAVRRARRTVAQHGDSLYSGDMFFRGQTIGKYRIVIAARQRRLRLCVPGRRHVDRQESRTQGPASAESRLRRAAARAAAAREPQPSEHRHGPHRGEAGQRLLHRDGIRAGRDARAHHRSRGRARSEPRARLHVPDLQRDGSRAPAGRHPPRPAPGQRARDRAGHGESGRLRHVAISRDRRPRHDRDRESAVHGARAVSGQGGVRLGHLFARRDASIRC